MLNMEAKHGQQCDGCDDNEHCALLLTEAVCGRLNGQGVLDFFDKGGGDNGCVVEGC